jgi:outer membrane lipoprotein-sorting protein
MRFRRACAISVFICLISLAFAGCAVRRRVVSRLGLQPGQTLKVADKQSLMAAVATQYAAIHDINATVDMTPVLGTAEKGKITEYKDVRAYILFRKPQSIRIIGLYPLVRGKAFDMVSEGQDFKLYIPSKDRFVVGKNEIIQPSANRIENLRPQHFLEALIVAPFLHPENVMLENYTDEDNAFYILHEVREKAGQQLLARTVWFSRYDLKIRRQMIFDDNGNILTDARYEQWDSFDNVPFPKRLVINRPRDEYGVVIDVVKMDVNKGVTDDKFVLTQPEGSKLQVIGEPPEATPSEPAPARKKT